MANRYELYVHAVWGTWRRSPQLVGPVVKQVRDAIEEKCVELRSPLIAIGGMADHVHVLCRLHPTVSIADLIHGLKGMSSHAVTRHEGGVLRWQRGYGVFTISADDVPAVRQYVLDQERHHATGRIDAMFERLDD